jgi:hypothetical protein
MHLVHLWPLKYVMNNIDLQVHQIWEDCFVPIRAWEWSNFYNLVLVLYHIHFFFYFTDGAYEARIKLHAINKSISD